MVDAGMIEEHWRLVDEVLGKKDRSRAQAERLQQTVAELLGTADGRASITARLAGKATFKGKYRFANEVVKAFETEIPQVAGLSANDRLSLQEVIIENTRPGMDQAHWNMLWLVERDGHAGAGKMVLASLAKVSKKRDDLARTLPGLDAWQRPWTRTNSLASGRRKALLQGP
jgi:hypothetical protein